jgi:hypothetical protein
MAIELAIRQWARSDAAALAAVARVDAARLMRAALYETGPKRPERAGARGAFVFLPFRAQLDLSRGNVPKVNKPDRCMC